MFMEISLKSYIYLPLPCLHKTRTHCQSVDYPMFMLAGQLMYVYVCFGST